MDTKVHEPFLNRFRWWNLLLLLLLCFINYCGTTPIPVPGIKGGSATLSCELEDHEISVIVLNRLSRNILVCQNDECKSVNDSKVFKKGACDIILNNLIFSDSGKYILKVYYKNTQAKVEQQILEYHLHIHDDISVKTGEKVKLDVLLINADKVERQNINSTEWTEVWKRGEEVQSNRLNIGEETLIISNFTVSDTGTYRVLDSNNEILITVTVTESSAQSKGEANDSEQHKSVIIVVSVIGALVLALIISAVIWKYQRQHRNAECAPVPMEEHLETTLETCNHILL